MDNSGQGGLAGQVLDLLAEGAALRVADMRAVLASRGVPCSLKGLYKALAALEEAQWVKKHKMAYSLDITKVLSVQDYWQGVYERQMKRFGAQALAATGKTVWRFHSVQQYMPFNNELYILLMQNAKTPVVREWVPYAWFHLCGGDQEDRFLNVAAEKQVSFYRIIGTDGHLARMMEPSWRASAGAFSFARSPFHVNRHEFTGVVDDWVVTVKIPPGLKGDLDRLFTAVKTIDSAAFSHINAVMARRYPVTMTLERDAVKAARLRGRFDDYFDV